MSPARGGLAALGRILALFVWILAACLPGAAGGFDGVFFLGWTSVSALGVGLWLASGLDRRACVSLWLLGAVAAALGLIACTTLGGGDGLAAAPRCLLGLAPVLAGLAAGLGLGHRLGSPSRVRAAALAALLFLALLSGLPTRYGMGGSAFARRSPAAAGWVFSLSPWTLSLEAAGLDWQRHPAVYERAGTDWFSGQRAGWNAREAALIELLLGVLLGAGLLLTSPKSSARPGPDSGAGTA